MICLPCKREFRFTINMKIMYQTPPTGDSAAYFIQLYSQSSYTVLKSSGKYFSPWQPHFPTSWKYRFAHIHNMIIENKI